jgi:hypothetical protein
MSHGFNFTLNFTLKLSGSQFHRLFLFEKSSAMVAWEFFLFRECARKLFQLRKQFCGLCSPSGGEQLPAPPQRLRQRDVTSGLISKGVKQKAPVFAFLQKQGRRNISLRKEPLADDGRAAGGC